MKLSKSIVTLCNLAFSYSILSAPPSGWQSMEIEAKWELSSSQYRSLVSDFKDGSKFEDYDVSVRWDGYSAKFVDTYYDFEGRPLTLAGHSLRHRTRLSLEDKSDLSSNSLSNLKSARWERDWERLQYKSTPYRLGAVWFRKETGDCLLWNAKKNKNACRKKDESTVIEYLSGLFPHEAMTAMKEDHSYVNLTGIKTIATIVDYRYRVEFLKNNRVVFEMSLDRLEEMDHLSGVKSQKYEGELEILEENFDEATLEKLYEMTEKIQSQYQLTPSIYSKGGILVNEN